MHAFLKDTVKLFIFQRIFLINIQLTGTVFQIPVPVSRVKEILLLVFGF